MLAVAGPGRAERTRRRRHRPRSASIVMGNDGTLLGFPHARASRWSCSRARPTASSCSGPNRKPGLVSVPPLDITEHLLAFAAPAGAQGRLQRGLWLGRARCHRGRQVNPRSEGKLVSPAPGRIRVQADAARGRPTFPRDPTARRRDITLAGLRRQALHAGQPQRMVDQGAAAGRPARQVPAVEGRHHARRSGLCPVLARRGTRRSSTTAPASRRSRGPARPAGSRPFDFARDDIELGDSPGIDCSSTMWFVYTRACKGDVRIARAREGGPRAKGRLCRPPAQVPRRTSGSACCSPTRTSGPGFVSTNIMANHPEIMKDHFVDCMGTALQTGDILVTRNTAQHRRPHLHRHRSRPLRGVRKPRRRRELGPHEPRGARHLGGLREPRPRRARRWR